MNALEQAQIIHGATRTFVTQCGVQVRTHMVYDAQFGNPLREEIEMKSGPYPKPPMEAFCNRGTQTGRFKS